MKHFTTLLGSLGLALVMGVAASMPASAEGRVPLPAPAKAFKGEQCVEPAAVMRREHGNYLLHQRDETVKDGIRGNKYSLRGCIECHAVPDKMAGGERTVAPFCGECHQYAAVTINCFECHTNKPESIKASGVMPAGHGPSKTAFLGPGRTPAMMVAEVERYLSEGNFCYAPPSS